MTSKRRRGPPADPLDPDELEERRGIAAKQISRRRDRVVRQVLPYQQDTTTDEEKTMVLDASEKLALGNRKPSIISKCLRFFCVNDTFVLQALNFVLLWLTAVTLLTPPGRTRTQFLGLACLAGLVFTGFMYWLRHINYSTTQTRRVALGAAIVTFAIAGVGLHQAVVLIPLIVQYITQTRIVYEGLDLTENMEIQELERIEDEERDRKSAATQPAAAPAAADPPEPEDDPDD